MAYCPTAWMSCSGQTKNMINKLLKRPHRIALNDRTSNFKTLLAESSDICNHHKNTQTLMTKAYKIQTNLAFSITETIPEKKYSI